ncbi:hypothetical protein T4E_1365 [Trichinella pseudospiralis]|uniref:Uncharacterized protein n=1 Tax=Trichinella pseudospiralis TaxID=6337 RepID=A0A0V0YPB7_TRIPS|nr:hypothetical protein T4E_1365 [Trichinella pseudospiralis]
MFNKYYEIEQTNTERSSSSSSSSGSSSSRLRKSFPIIETVQLKLVDKSGFGEVEPSTSVSLGVKTDAKFSGVPWSKWQVDTPLFDRLSAGHSGRRYQLHGKAGLLLAKQAVTSCVLRLHQLQSTSFEQSMPKYAEGLIQ